MQVVLAFEPDLRQASALERIVRDRVGATFVLAESKDQAIAAIRSRIPDLILLTAFVSPSAGNARPELIRDTEGAEHTQTLTIPLLDLGQTKTRSKKRGLLRALTGGAASPSGPAGCDPGVVAEEIRNYLQQAEHLKKEAAASRERGAKRRLKKKDAAPASEAPVTSHEPGSSGNGWSWDVPLAADAATPSTPAGSFEIPAAARPTDGTVGIVETTPAVKETSPEPEAAESRD